MDTYIALDIFFAASIVTSLMMAVTLGVVIAILVRYL